MSYLARAARADGPGSAGSAPSLRPALRSDSPLVERDQRLAMADVSSVDTPDMGGEAEGVGEQLDGGLFSAFQPSLHAPSAIGAEEPAPRREAIRTPFSERVSVRAPAVLERPFHEAGPAVSGEHRVERSERGPSENEVAAKSDAPVGAPRPVTPLEPRRRAGGRRAEDELEPGPSSVSVRGEGPAGGEPSPATAPFNGPLRDALSRIEAWMRSETPRSEAAKRREPSAAPSQARGSAQPSFAGRGDVSAQAAEPAAPPRLTIGRIDVEVVTPQAAPRLVPVRTGGRGAAPARGDADLGKLGFGLRQR